MMTRCKSEPRVALVCDWLTTPGGAEKVLLELHRMYQQAPIYTSQYRRRGIDWFDDAEVRTGWLQIFPAKLRKVLGPLRQIYFNHLDLSEYDVVISVTGAEAKSVRTKSRDGAHEAYHLCYCHVPTQYYWQMYDQYIENPGFGFLNPIIRTCLRLFVGHLRKADYAAAQRPDQFVTISNYAKRRIQQYYHREAKVVAPPVEVQKFFTKKPTFSTKAADLSTNSFKKSTIQSDFFAKKAKKSTNTASFSTTFPQFFHSENSKRTIPYYIIACRQVTWKRVDLAIQACLEAKRPLLVVGNGPEHARLVDLAANSPWIQFLPWVQTEELAFYLQHARGYIFPSLEPFGIAAVEALAAGCPVIAYDEGGSRDFIKAGQNGVLFAEQTASSIVAAIEEFERIKFNRSQVSASAQPFAAIEFRRKIQRLVAQGLGASVTPTPLRHQKHSQRQKH